jgi:hypothetical protein
MPRRCASPRPGHSATIRRSTLRNLPHPPLTDGACSMRLVVPMRLSQGLIPEGWDGDFQTETPEASIGMTRRHPVLPGHQTSQLT